MKKLTKKQAKLIAKQGLKLRNKLTLKQFNLLSLSRAALFSALSFTGSAQIRFSFVIVLSLPGFEQR